MRIVVGGQLDKQEIADFIKGAIKDSHVEVKNDLDAVMAIKSGSFDYYVGACNTGGGGALAMALALLGKDKCETLSMPGVVKSEEEIVNAVNSNKIAFGFTAQHRDQILPVLCKALFEKK